MYLNRNVDRLCAVVILSVLLFAGIVIDLTETDFGNISKTTEYENLLFDRSRVHQIDIFVDDWDVFLNECENEAYTPCDVQIDGENFNYVGLRAKGNTSLANLRMISSKRYSLKMEFDHYEPGESYHGLDKLCINNLIQDNTYMKDYLTYRIMAEYGVPAPLCVYADVSVNGEPWGLFLVVEGVEESFIRRNYGSSDGVLYKPDSMGFANGPPPGGNVPPPPEMGRVGNPDSPPPGGNVPPAPGVGASDVALRYTDDDPNNYVNIFSTAKTPLSGKHIIALIQALKVLGEGKSPDLSVDTDQMIRYFVVHNYTVNGDSYTGNMVHNYYLYEQSGILSMIPWDYNLAFGGFQGGSATTAVNDPIDTP